MPALPGVTPRYDSENKLHAELHVTRVIALRGYKTKRRRVVWVETDARSEVRVVEGIQ